MLRTSVWLVLLGFLWHCGDCAQAQLFRRQVRTIPRVYYVPGPGGCVSQPSWGQCPGVVYSCDGCVIWIWDAGDACCQPCQPPGKQAPSAAAKAKPAPQPPQTTVLRPKTKPKVKESVSPPAPPPAAAPAKPPAPEAVKPAPAADQPKPEAPAVQDLETTLKARGGFDKLLAAATTARALEELTGGGPFTVFAPSDEAFAKLDPQVLERLLAAPDRLYDLLSYHAFAGKLTADEALQRGSVKTIQGGELKFRRDGTQLQVNDATVTEADIACTNGMLQLIDRVLFPPGFELPAAAAPETPPTGAAAAKPAGEAPPSEPKTP